MAERSSSRILVEEYVRRFDPEVQRIIRAARAVVRKAAPRIEERAWRAWPVRFALEGSELIWLGGYSDHANLGFFRAKELDDPDGLLGGTGERLRHVRLRSVADARRPAVRRLIAQAVRLATSEPGGTAMGRRR